MASKNPVLIYQEKPSVNLTNANHLLIYHTQTLCLITKSKPCVNLPSTNPSVNLQRINPVFYLPSTSMC